MKKKVYGIENARITNPANLAEIQNYRKERKPATRPIIIVNVVEIAPFCWQNFESRVPKSRIELNIFFNCFIVGIICKKDFFQDQLMVINFQVYANFWWKEKDLFRIDRVNEET